MGVLSLESVGRRHRAGRETVGVLRGVSLELWPGDVVAIRGGRRSGKTTLLRVAAGVEAPDDGVVRLDGCNLAGVCAAERTRRLRAVGYAPKQWRVARGKPVVDHVALPLLADARPLATALAKAYEAMELVEALDLVGAAAHELTSGELTRVALARALVRGPRVLLVDEPGATAAVEEREAILRLLRTIATDRRELAIAMTSCDTIGLSGARRVMALGEGRLRAFEEPAAVVPFPARPGALIEPVT